MQEKFLLYLKEKINEDRLPHAFLLVNINEDDMIQKINTVLFETNTVFDKDINNNPYIKILYSDSLIDKSKITELKESFLTTTFDNNKKLYFIKQVDKLNVSASNKLLKFLEEPENNILGFLFTNNINAVLPTIKSRCEIFYLNDIKTDISEEISNEADEFLVRLNNKEIHENFIYIKKILEYNREDILVILNLMFENLNEDLKNNTSKNFQKLAKNIKLLDNIIELLEHNMNIELTLNKLCIEWWK